MFRAFLVIYFSLLTAFSFSQVETSASGEEEGYEYVDLGLSVYWATKNVGSESPKDWSEWHAWGEIRPKEKDDWQTYLIEEGAEIESYKDCGTDADPMRDYVFPNCKPICYSQFDVANYYWGGDWRMPTKEEFEELIAKCSMIWIDSEGEVGCKVIGTNGNVMFLPAADSKDLSSLGYDWPYAYYWTATPSENNSFCAYFFYMAKKHRPALEYYDRYTGLQIRPVLNKK